MPLLCKSLPSLVAKAPALSFLRKMGEAAFPDSASAQAYRNRDSSSFMAFKRALQDCPKLKICLRAVRPY